MRKEGQCRVTWVTPLLLGELTPERSLVVPQRNRGISGLTTLSVPPRVQLAGETSMPLVRVPGQFFDALVDPRDGLWGRLCVRDPPKPHCGWQCLPGTAKEDGP